MQFRNINTQFLWYFTDVKNVEERKGSKTGKNIF